MEQFLVETFKGCNPLVVIVFSIFIAIVAVVLMMIAYRILGCLIMLHCWMKNSRVYVSNRKISSEVEDIYKMKSEDIDG